MPGEVARTDYSLRGINCQAFFLPPCLVPFLQLIPHFLSKIPRELLVCVFPRHVLICHPLPLAVTAQAFHGHSLCCLLSPEQAGGSGVTIRKGRSHQLHARKRCPHRISPCLSSLHLQVPKTAIFFLLSALALETPGHPGNVSGGTVKCGEASRSSLPSAPGEKDGRTVGQSGNPVLGSGHQTFTEGKHS